MLLLFIGVVLLGIILTYTFLKRRFTPSVNDPPGAEPQIFFGNLLNSGILTGKLVFNEAMLDYQRRYGDKFIFWFGQHPCLIFCLPEHAQAIFTNRNTFDQSPLSIPNFDLVCPHNIVMSTGPKWKRHIRVMLPMFKRAKIINYSESIIDCADHFIDQHLHDGRVHTDLLFQCRTLTMNIFVLIAFDYDLNNTIDSPFKMAFENFFYNATLIMMIPWIPRWMIRLYLRLNWKYQRACRLIREQSEKLVEQEQNNQDTMESQRPKNLIASLVSSLNEQANDEQISSGLTRAEMFDEILVAIMAGSETTSTALSWFIFYMSKYPRVQQCIKEELRKHDLLMTDDVNCVPPLTHETLNSLIYCDCVMKEVLRLAPIASLAGRMALCDTIIDDVSIRSGQTVFIALHNMHCDPRYWHIDPNQFEPERFLEEDKDHHPYALSPFGGGHRACIGQDLALFELKLIIVRWMQRGLVFEDTPENIGGYEEQLTCFPKKLAVRVRFERH